MTLSDIATPWASIDAALGLGHDIRDEAQYERLLAFVEEAVDRIGGQDNHPLWTLIALIGERIREYENRVHPWPDTSTPASCLTYLIREHGLRQSDLPEVGSQSVLSEILSGKRALNLRQVKALSARFGVPMEVFAG